MTGSRGRPDRPSATLRVLSSDFALDRLTVIEIVGIVEEELARRDQSLRTPDAGILRHAGAAFSSVYLRVPRG